MNVAETLLIVPTNDAEAILIFQIAKKIGLKIYESIQKHGAILDDEKNIISFIKKSGCKNVVIVEMPGLKMEKKIQQLGYKLRIIDHHHYTNIDRAHGKDGKLLKSSLEQFLELFKINDRLLVKIGFDPKLVRGIGLLDRGFIWLLLESGYSKKEVWEVLKFHDELFFTKFNKRDFIKIEKLAKKLFETRKMWNGNCVMASVSSCSLRGAVSRIMALHFQKPTPLILAEYKRGYIYVQESKHAMKLFKIFGGFTFGEDKNWGYKNEKEKKVVWIRDVKRILIDR